MRTAISLILVALLAGCSSWDRDEKHHRSKKDGKHKCEKKDDSRKKKDKKDAKDRGGDESVPEALAAIEHRLSMLEAAVERLEDGLERPAKTGDGGVKELPQALRGLEGPPQIEGLVVGVSTKYNLVVINRGEEHGVQVGFEFVIFRGTEYVARMVIEKVYPNQAAGRTISIAIKNKVLVGDKAAIRLY